jgi:uncharacterized protein (TIGR02246 family)
VDVVSPGSREQASREQAEADIRRLVDEAVAHQSDVDRFLALHTDDLVLVNVAGTRVLGKPALRTAMEKALSTSLSGVLTENEVVDITFVGPSAALVSCIKRITDTNAPGDAVGGLPTTASLTYLVVETDGGWRIALAQTTPVR